MDKNNLGKGEWISVFKNRGVWNITEETILKWKFQNQAFFSYIETYISKDKKILELGCGPARHAISIASLGYKVEGIDVDEEILVQARINASNFNFTKKIMFGVKNMFDLNTYFKKDDFHCITHGGLMEHFDSISEIQKSLMSQLQIAEYVIFDIPLGTKKNIKLFEKDDIFRQLWSEKQWLEDVLSEFLIISSTVENHDPDNMTDDLVCVIKRREN